MYHSFVAVCKTEIVHSVAYFDTRNLNIPISATRHNSSYLHSSAKYPKVSEMSFSSCKTQTGHLKGL